MSELPYGPNTAVIRRFLVRLAGLGKADRAAVLERYTSHCASRTWESAETAMATGIERSGREPQRDALTGPLLQLVRTTAGASPLAPSDADPLAELDPVAEPALAALLALLVRDLLSTAHTETLYAPFEAVIPFRDVVPSAGS